MIPTSVQSAKTVAIVVPLSNRTDLTASEELSLKHLVHFLGEYDKYFVAPEGLNFHWPGFTTRYFSPKYFGSVSAHAKMMLSQGFYERFSDYTYILFYHLDSLVFSNQLRHWCALDFDYIGAPWIQCADTPWVKNSAVGNGGFSLRRVQSFLKVLQSSAYWIDPAQYWHNICSSPRRHWRLLYLPNRYVKHIRPLNNVHRHITRQYFRKSNNEDIFWGRAAKKYHATFNIPSVEIALSFAFEAAPQLCYELNHHKLPFGCHAWERYDRKFWEPYLLS
jgi:Protein of unknown function (DUF5672)